MCDRRILKVHPIKELIDRELTNLISDVAEKSIKRDEIFKVGLSGGSMVKFVSEAFSKISTDWSKWRFFL